MANNLITINHLYKSYGPVLALNDVCLDIKKVLSLVY